MDNNQDSIAKIPRPCPICGKAGMMFKPSSEPDKPGRPAGWCGSTSCFEILAMDGFRAIIARLNEGPNEELLRLQTVVRRLLAGIKDARHWCRVAIDTESSGPMIITNPRAAIASLEKAALECGLEIPE